LRRALLLLVVAGSGTGCGQDTPAGPTLRSLQLGRYVLTALGAEPAPFVYYRIDYHDTLSVTLSFAFDTVRILSDTSFTRHFRREALALRPGRADSLVDAEEFDYPGIILDRGEEVKLTTRFGTPGGSPIAYFVPRDTALARHAQVVRYSCMLEICTLTLDRRVDAWYARR
jgi:hypothetical protein